MKAFQAFLGIFLLIASSKAQEVRELSDSKRLDDVSLTDGEVMFIVANETLEKWVGYKPILYVWVEPGDCPPGGTPETHYVELTSLDSDVKAVMGCGEKPEQNAFNATLSNTGWQQVQVKAVGSDYAAQVHAELRISKKIILNDVLDEVNLKVSKEVEYWIEMEETEESDAFFTLGITKMVSRRESVLTLGYVNTEGNFVEVEYAKRDKDGGTGDFIGINSFGPMRLRIMGEGIKYLEVGISRQKAVISGECPEEYEKCREWVYADCPSIANMTFCIPKTKTCDGRLNCPAKCPNFERNETGMTSTFVYEEDTCRCAQRQSYCGYGYCSSEFFYSWGFSHIWWSMSLFVMIIMMSCCIFAVTMPLRRRRRAAAMARQRVQRIQNTAANVDPFKTAPPPSYDDVVVVPNRH